MPEVNGTTNTTDVRIHVLRFRIRRIVVLLSTISALLIYMIYLRYYVYTKRCDYCGGPQ